jgi:hypothetical protein
VFFLIALIIAVLGFYFLSAQRRENSAIDAFIEELELDKTNTWENAVEISKKLRTVFNSDKHSFETLSLKNKPFLREECDLLIQAREGLCGEGARVLVCLLERLGFDATRVTLFTRWLHPSHTLVSIIHNGQEYFIDTLNSGDEFNAYVNSHRLAAEDFSIMGHVEDIGDRTRQKKALMAKSSDDVFEEHVGYKYLFYSYEAIPFSKLASALRLNLRIVNLRRPSKAVSLVAEKPKLVKAGVCFILAGASFIIALL